MIQTERERERRGLFLAELQKFEARHPEMAEKLAAIVVYAGSSSSAAGKGLSVAEHVILDAIRDISNFINSHYLPEEINRYVGMIERRELASPTPQGWVLLDDFKLTLLESARVLGVELPKTSSVSR